MIELKRLFGYLRPYSGRLIVALVASAFFSLFTLALAALVRPLIDVDLGQGGAAAVHAPDGGVKDGQTSPPTSIGEGDASPPTLAARWAAALRPSFIDQVPFSLLVLFVFAGRGLSSYVSRYLIGWVAERSVADLRADIGAAIAQQSVGYFSDRSTGELIARMTSDPEKILQALSEKLFHLVREVLTMGALAGYLFVLEWPLAIMALVLTPAVIIPISKVGRKLRRSAERSQQSVADLATRIHELVRGIRIVKASSAEELEKARIAETAKAIFIANMRSVKVIALTPPAMELLAGMGVALAFLYGQHKIAAGAMTRGEFVSFLTALSMLYGPAKNLTRVQAAFEQAVASARRCFRVIDARVTVVESANARPLPPVKGELCFDNVSFKYDDQPVLRDLDFILPAGAVTALVGRSGAGKTTVANLILRFYDPTSGRITIDGHDLRDVNVKSLRAQIGFVPQDVVLFNDSLRANIAYAMTGVSEERMRDAARAAFIDEFISTLPAGYETRVGEGGVKLSTGQRQRIAIARALLKDPPCLVLDEATSALDTESEALVVRALANLMRGRTTLVIAHRLSTVRRADRILVLEAGQLRESGTHDELVSARGGLYSRLVELQSSGELFESEEGGVLP